MKNNDRVLIGDAVYLGSGMLSPIITEHIFVKYGYCWRVFYGLKPYILRYFLFSTSDGDTLMHPIVQSIPYWSL
jgi:hypothetical protein